MKQRFSSLDIKVIAHELSKSLTSLRVSNIYDLSSRIFLFKFAKPDHRQQLVVDSGFRCHLTDFARSTAGSPSAFVSRLRKFLKTRRVTSVSQVGTDRILEIQFSDGQYRLFLEFYAGGNIVLTDGDLKVIALLRNVNEGAEHERLRLGVDYNLSLRQNINGAPPLSIDRVKKGIENFIQKQAKNEQVQTKKSKKKQAGALKSALASCITEFPPMLLDHALHKHQIDTDMPLEKVAEDEGLLNRILAALQEADILVKEITETESATGYIIGKPKAEGVDAIPTAELKDVSKARHHLMYQDFHPFRPFHVESDPSVVVVEVESFNRTVDEFFSSIEGQRLDSKLQEREEMAKKKIEQTREIQESRLKGLQDVQEFNVRKAQAIEANLERVEEATAAINGLIAQGMDWTEIDRLIERERGSNNAVASMIKLPLKLQENTATLLLGEMEVDEEEDDDEMDLTDSDPSDDEDDDQPVKSKKAKAPESQKSDKRLAVDINLALSGWSNAREYYDQKKNAAAKQEKTAQSQQKAFRSAKQKIETDLKKALKQEKDVLRPIRKQFWFEKFIYFISSDGYLVLGGKDAQQVEILYKKYLKAGDVFVHADLNNAMPLIIKNKSSTPDAPIPPSTLAQAGHMSVCTSTAWDSKAVMSAWWANSKQVSKTASTGDYLGVGKFEIKGEKHFLPPAQLLLGFAVMFHISEASKAQHLKHRIPQEDVEISTISTDEEPAPAPADLDGYISDHETSTSKTEDASADTGDDDDDDDADTVEGEEDNDDNYSVTSAGNYINPLQAGKTAPDEATLDTSKPLQHQGSASDADSEPDAEAEQEDEDEDDDDDDVAEGSQSYLDSESVSVQDHALNSNPGSQSKPQPHVRGKRGKKAKIAAKYRNQDPEDREEALRLLGSKAGQERAEAEAKAKEEKKEQAEEAKQRRREQHLRAQEEGKAREEKRLMAQQGDGVEDENEENNVDLDTLIGTPRPGDEILEAIPVCAPWAALGKFKYKAKLQPGATKKGKAVREILGKWNADAANKKAVDEKAEDTERMWPREIELLKGWKETEVFNVLPVGKVRVMMAGASGGGGGGKGGGGKGKGGGGKGGGRGGKKK